MRLASVSRGGRLGVAVETGSGWKALFAGEGDLEGGLDEAVKTGRPALRDLAVQIERMGTPLEITEVTVMPPVSPGRIICVGLNYADHAAEANMQVPAHPTLFSRFASSVVGPNDAISLPRVSEQLDFEGELAVIIGLEGRHIGETDALRHVAGYACFNDVSVRDYQLRTTQWMLGKNFDGTGPFGPFLVTPDDLPDGASGLAIETRLNGKVVQSSSTDQLIFDVAKLIADVSEAIRIQPGDVIITGTPSGVGHARTPKLYMKAGDLCEVEIEKIGTLSNRVVADV